VVLREHAAEKNGWNTLIHPVRTYGSEATGLRD